jgi:hypothetical protein
MVALGFIVDDNPKSFLASYHQERSGTGKHEIYIRLEEVGA